MKKRRMVLSFTKGELKRASIQLGNAGIMMAVPQEEVECKQFIQSFGITKDLDKLEKAKFSFGWFGGSDGNKFYPDLNVGKDLMPKEEDFVNVPFRMLSATVVAAGTWRSTDFTDTDVLRKAIKKLDRKPVYKEHDTDLDNWVGLVKTPVFSESFIDSEGRKIPAGLNAIISIDGKCNPKLARAVLAGGIYSDSVTVEFDWVPSHVFDNEDDFERNVGNVIDDRMVCRKVVEIIDFYEVSLVWLGADPYAKQIDTEGNLINVDESSTYNDEIVQTGYKKDGKFQARLGLAKNLLSLSKKDTKIPQKSLKTEKMEKILEALRKKLNLAAGTELTDAHLPAVEAALNAVVIPDNTELAAVVSEVTGETVPATEKADVMLAKLKGKKAVKAEEFARLTALNTEVEALKTDKASLAGEVAVLKGEKVTLTASVAEMTPKVTIADSFMAEQRAEVKRLYHLSVGGAEKAVKAVEELIEKSDVAALKGLSDSYTGGITKSFSGSCKSCGSKDFTFQSSVGGQEDGGTGGASQISHYDGSFEDIHSKFQNKDLNIPKK